MRIETTRFGTVEAAEDEVLRFGSGIIGFPEERMYVLIPHGTSQTIAWLQSVKTKELAFPVVSAHGFVVDYPDVPLLPIARRMDVGESLEELAILVVMSAPRNQAATVNLLAPLVINSRTRNGVQVFLEGSKYTTRELFVIPKPTEQPGDETLPRAKLAAL
jgi:flagellar assembly factor FliW